MVPNAFIGNERPPTGQELATALGASKTAWDRLLADLAGEMGVQVQEWKSYSPKAGWSLRLKRKARTIVWLGPRAGSFVAAFILGDKAMRAARGARLPKRIVNALDNAPKYPEGTGVRITIKAQSQVAAVKALATIKLAN